MLEKIGDSCRTSERERRAGDAVNCECGEDYFYAKGLRFSCAQCSACCRYESGYVFLSEKDAALLSAALKISYVEFVEVFCRWVPAENGLYALSLKEKSNFDCIFWSSRPVPVGESYPTDSRGHEGGCSVYEARPLQCRAFPFWLSVLSSEDNWKITAADCPGMNRGAVHSPESIEKWLFLRRNEPIISKTTGVTKR